MADTKLIEALQLLASRPDVLQALLDQAKAAPAPVADVTVGELWAQWEPWASQKMPSWRVCRTQANAFRRVKVGVEGGQLVTLFELPWRQCTPHVANLYRMARRLESNGRKGRDGQIGFMSDSTVNRELTTLQSMLSYHRDTTKAVDHNPIDSWSRVDEGPGERQTALTAEQVAQFLETSHPLFNDICSVAYRSAGMRQSEARLLEKSEVDWDTRVINLSASRTKTRTARTIPFPDDVYDILKRHAGASRGPYVFVAPNCPKRISPVSKDWMQYWLSKARKTSGMVGVNGEPIVVHTLRHAGVTALVEVNAPGAFIRSAAGMNHKTYARYTKWKAPQQQILRGYQNRLASPPTPITETLHDERRAAKAKTPLRIAKSADDAK